MNIYNLKLLKQITRLKFNHYITWSKSIKMGNWKEEKDLYLNKSPDSKNKNCVKLHQIDSWKITAASTLPEKIPALTNCQIDASKNAVLCEKISIYEGDITKLAVDCIVNAANSSLRGGGGVDGAIHRAAGPSLLEECITLQGCPTGEAKITGGYKLPSKYVIHTVGPQGEIPEKLQNCYKNSLQLCLSNNLKSIAFPCISTGIYGYPNEAAAHIAIYETRKFLEANFDKFDRVIFCLFMPIDKNIYKGLLQSYFPVS